MQDRIPLYPGRVKLVPVVGQENTYDMTRADQPTQAGDPLNKSTLLSDAVATLYGLSSDAVPNDVFSRLGKYNQHWWSKRKIIAPSYSLETPTKTVHVDYGEIVNYADSVTVSEDGTVSLVNQSSVNTSFLYNDKESEIYNNKFYKGTFETDSPNEVASGVVYVPDMSKLTSGGSYFELKAQYVSIVKGVGSHPSTEKECVQSSDRSTYPDSGQQGGYEYEYLGIPFDNAVSAPKIEVGSYIGTGKYGEYNPNSLTFGFSPKLVIVSGAVENSASLIKLGCVIFVPGMTKYSPFNSGTYNKGTVSFKGNSVSWWAIVNDNATGFQLNVSNETYHYAAIG